MFKVNRIKTIAAAAIAVILALMYLREALVCTFMFIEEIYEYGGWPARASLFREFMEMLVSYTVFAIVLKLFLPREKRYDQWMIILSGLCTAFTVSAMALYAAGGTRYSSYYSACLISAYPVLFIGAITEKRLTWLAVTMQLAGLACLLLFSPAHDDGFRLFSYERTNIFKTALLSLLLLLHPVMERPVFLLPRKSEHLIGD